MRHPSMRALVGASLLAAALLAPAAHAAPVRFPMPDGSTIERDERDVAPYLAAWKAARATQEAAAARAATANQQAYDARWYDLALTFTPATKQVAGTVRMKATVVAGPLTTVDLDFNAGMLVDGATCAGAATTFTRSGDVLTLTLDRAYVNGETIDVTVTSHGDPTPYGYFGFPVANSRQLIWSLSEAYGARTWWPCKDAPEDKADSVDVHFTVPLGLTTASNGTLLSSSSTATTTTTNWRERYPIATYLVSIASYPYTVVNDWYVSASGDSMPLKFHLFPESAAGAATVDAKVKTMIATFASRFGEYPFLKEKYGHAEFVFGGGMEHQTCTSLGSYNEFVVAHELMHQWWGDMVTCRDFHHIWLNEGSATYGEALWDEATGGAAAYKANLAGNRWLGAGTIYVPDAANESRVFDSNLSYDKASWVLHMLRHMLGDTMFFNAMRQYRAQWAYKSATTEDFRDAFEAATGRDLHAFFQQWIYGEYYPIYGATFANTPMLGGTQVSVTLQQRQSWQLFTMPVDLTLTTAAGDTTITVPDSLASQTFTFLLPSPAIALKIDKDDGILKTLELTVTAPPFDRSVLVVNGVDWATYGTEITTAYTDRAFSGSYNIDFWDTFAQPAAGYPSPLPAPLGHGAVPPEVLGHYRNVIWVGNNFNGDLASWSDTPILSYLRAGGNVLLMTRMADAFLGDTLRTYLGVNWAATDITLNDCIASRPGFANVGRIGTQSLCAVFDTVRTTPESELLFRAVSGFTPNRGVGAVRSPAGGAGLRPRGGRFALLSGRPYRWDHTTLKNAVTQILTTRFFEPVSGVDAGSAPHVTALALAPPQPNPTRTASVLRFTLPHAAAVRLEVIDVTGRRIRTLLSQTLPAGEHEAQWDGRDDSGRPGPAGLYWVRLASDGTQRLQKLVRLR